MKIILYVVMTLLLNTAFGAGTKNEDGSFKLYFQVAKDYGDRISKIKW